MCMTQSPCKNYWNFVKMCPGHLLKICLVGFEDTLVKFVKSLARWQHLAASGVFSYRVQYTYSTVVLAVDGGSGYCGTCCTPCLACQLSDRLDENMCLPLCVGIVPLRQKIRMMLGIRVRFNPIQCKCNGTIRYDTIFNYLTCSQKTD